VNGPISKAEWEELRRHSVSGIGDVIDQVGLPAALLPYQQKAVGLLDSAGTSVLVVEKSRRIGLTWGLAAYCVLRAARERKAGGMDAMYISYSQEMTREFIDACAMWARAFAVAATAVDEVLFDDGDDEGQRSIQAFRIRFASGFEVLALSSAPRTLRGKQGVVIIDEAAFVDNLKELLKAALAFLMWGGQVVICSTHDGAENEFNVLVQDILAGRKPYTHLRIDFDDALRDGLYQRICLVTGREWSPEAEAAWRQEIIEFYADGADEELFCVPSLGSGAWLPGPLIEARMTADCPILRWELPPDFLHRSALEQKAMVAAFMDELKAAVARFDPYLMHALGFDFARVGDLSVVWVFAIDRLLRRVTALVVEMRRIPYEEQAAVTEAIIRAMPRPLGAAFDATGAGEYVAEAMARKFGAVAMKEDEPSTGIIASIKFSQEWYRTEMPPVKAAFEDDAIALPRDDEILSDLRLVKVIRGIPQVPPERTGEKGKRRHGDAAVALALAYFATRMRVEAYGYVSGRRDQRDDFDRHMRRLDEDLSLGGRGDGLW
jgi:phage FluMu gp28-like protein